MLKLPPEERIGVAPHNEEQVRCCNSNQEPSAELVEGAIKTCKSEQQEVNPLAFRINDKPGTTSPIGSIKAATNSYQPLRNLRDVRVFLDFTSRYRSYIDDYTKVSQPLRTLAEKGAELAWGEEQQTAYDELVRRLTTPVPCAPDQQAPDLGGQLFMAATQGVKPSLKRPVPTAAPLTRDAVHGSNKLRREHPADGPAHRRRREQHAPQEHPGRRQQQERRDF